MKLYNYFRSSAAFRVRIALNLKALAYDYESVNLKPGVDAQHSEDYRSLNPQQRVPFLVDGEVSLSQSTAIIEYLDARYPQPKLLPETIETAAKVRELVNLIACDIHPLNNLSVLKKLQTDFSASQEQIDQWYKDWINNGFSSLEILLNDRAGQYSVGDDVTLADVYLVPQVWNALRYQVDLTPYPCLLQIYRQCLSLHAFTEALPDNQPDNPEK